MKVIIAGSRGAVENELSKALTICSWTGFISTVISGGASGVDFFGERWAHKKKIVVSKYPADWEKYGKKAGPIRNEIMAQNAHGLIAVWDGASRGTTNMIDNAIKYGLRVAVWKIDSQTLLEYPAKEEFQNLWDYAEERAAIKEFSAGLSKEEAEKEAAQEIIGSTSSNEVSTYLKCLKGRLFYSKREGKRIYSSFIQNNTSTPNVEYLVRSFSTSYDNVYAIAIIDEKGKIIRKLGYEFVEGGKCKFFFSLDNLLKYRNAQKSKIKRKHKTKR